MTQVSARELVAFLKDFRDLSDSRKISTSQALELLSRHTDSSELAYALEVAGYKSKAEFSLSEILYGSPEIFPPLFRELFGRGEEEGMDLQLDRLLQYYERLAKEEAFYQRFKVASRTLFWMIIGLSLIHI